LSLLEHCLIPDWPAPKHVRALQTTRNGGVSAAPYASLNLGDHVGDNPLAVSRNRMLLAHLLPGEPVWLKQVHGIVVVDAAQAVCGCDTLLVEQLAIRLGEPNTFAKSLVMAKPAVRGSSRLAASDETTGGTTAPDGFAAPCRGGYPQADACITSHPGTVCVVMAADCLPVLLCDEQGSTVGAVHAGWRGLCDGVIESTVHAMNVPPFSLMAWLGPAIGPQAFEVGEEVRAAFVAQQPEAAAAFISGISGKWYADIYLLARLRLNALGVTRIYGGGLCTHTDSMHFFSYRRDGVTGRMGTFIWLE